jgi:hypothetical protein
MNRRNSFFSVGIVVLFLSGFSLTLRAQSEDQMQRFRQEKITFFNENLDLSEADAAEFWPVYKDFNNRSMKINEDERVLFSYIMNNYDNLSEEEIDQNMKKYRDLQTKRCELDARYHDKFVDIIGEKKTLKMYALERDFRMHLLRKFRGPHGGGDRGKGQGRRQEPLH